MILSALLAALTVNASPAQERWPPSPQTAWDASQAEYLHWSARRIGWSETETGLQYRRTSRPHRHGARPAETDTFRVHYRGTFTDGREFDSSLVGEPVEFPLNRVIKGWTEGVGLMRVGETFEFVIPADLAYGDRWVGGDAIPPGSVLAFTVELLDVVPAPAAAP